MKTILSAALIAGSLLVVSAPVASAETTMTLRSERSLGQAAKRAFRLGNRGWRILALSATVGMSAVEAHAQGYDAGRAAQKIGGDIGNEVIGTVRDAAYVGGYLLNEAGRGAYALFEWVTD